MTLICQIIYMYNHEYIKAVYRIKIFQYIFQHLVYDYISVGTFNSKSLMTFLIIERTQLIFARINCFFKLIITK